VTDPPDTRSLPQALNHKSLQAAQSAQASKKTINTAASDLVRLAGAGDPIAWNHAAKKFLSFLQDPNNADIHNGPTISSMIGHLQRGLAKQQQTPEETSQAIAALAKYTDAEIDKAVQATRSLAQDLASDIAPALRNAHTAVLDIAADIIHNSTAGGNVNGYVDPELSDQLIAATDKMGVLASAAGRIPVTSIKQSESSVQTQSVRDNSPSLADAVKNLYAPVMRQPQSRPSSAPSSPDLGGHRIQKRSPLSQFSSNTIHKTVISFFNVFCFFPSNSLRKFPAWLAAWQSGMGIQDPRGHPKV